jgi:prevent-host-death family protein
MPHGYYGHVKTAGVAELKNQLSRYLDHVRAGGTVIVLDRDQPVARIVPIAGLSRGRGAVDQRLLRLERQGLIRRGRGGLPGWAGRRPRRARRSVLKALLHERETGW